MGNQVASSVVALRSLSIRRGKTAPFVLRFSSSDRTATAWCHALYSLLDGFPAGETQSDDGSGRWDSADEHTLSDDERTALLALFVRAGDVENEAFPKLKRATALLAEAVAVTITRYWTAADGRTPLQRALEGTASLSSFSVGRARDIESAALRGLRDLLGHQVQVVLLGSDVLVLTIFRRPLGVQVFFGARFDWKHHVDLVRFSDGDLPSAQDLENSVEAWWLLSDAEKQELSPVLLDDEAAVSSCGERAAKLFGKWLKAHLSGDMSFFEEARANRRAAFLAEHGPNPSWD